MLSNQYLASNRGYTAEQKAKSYLEQHSLVFIEQNFKSKVSEIDLIMRDQEQLVFVEVKFRKNASHGSAAEQFTKSKRNKLEKAIYYYLLKNKLNAFHTSFRIDVVAIDAEKVNWIKNV
ncbi:YraN family protein [Glaciecola sp. MH2013]|uniref:YraN family protein n=1 Tax=Glaciecola sp. MH2013 TaxID=2785524 RepID=UPI00189CBE78|nr:YraN family protein [Glaciecola sp. MH2013]MBF7075047.1 YraN family protein [Glaciecola sp. MH2013]